MTFENFLFAASLRAAAILAIAYVASLVLSLCRASAAARHKLWALSLTASLGVPLLIGALPVCHLSLPLPTQALSPWPPSEPIANTSQATQLPAAVEPVAQTTNPSLLPLDPAGPQLDSEVLTIHKPAEPEASRLPVPITTWFFLVWTIGAGLTISPLLLGLMSLRLLERSSELVSNGPLQSVLDQGARQYHINRPIQLLTSAKRSMPMTWGLWKPAILLPVEAEDWSPERLRVVLHHELAHVARRDCLWQFTAQLARAMYWFNPLIWLAERQLRIEQERACDDLVLSRGFNPPDYADHLLAVSASCSRVSACAPALAMSHSSNLENRLMAILNPSLNRHPLSRGVARSMVIITIAATVLVSLTHVEARVAASDAAAQKDVKNADPPAVVVDRSQALAILRAKINEQYVTPVNDNDILEGALKGMIGALKDPYSDYLTPESLAAMEKQISSAIVGIGVQLEMVDKQIRIVTPLAGSPALKAGVQPGDAILEIDGQSTAGLGLPDVVKRIAGPAGTNVRLKISREDRKSLDLNIARGSVSLPTVSGFRRAADNNWNLLLAESHKIGYLQISQFGTATPREAREALESLKQQGAKGLILDLRYCPGGMLDSAVAVAKLLLASGTIVTLHPRTGDPTTLKADATVLLDEEPLLVLINEQTASAGEVLAGALQDNHRAVILGTRTTGKASVQTLIKLDGDTGAIKLTTAEYRLPSGRNIDKRSSDKTWGINPDDGYFVPTSSAQSKALLDRRRQREIIQAGVDKDVNRQPEITAASLEQQENDPQLAAALKTMTARVESGAFTKVSTLTPTQIDQILKRQAIEQRRETARQTLEKIDRELAELN
jgi:carboxyl-terminal processing protease